MSLINPNNEEEIRQLELLKRGEKSGFDYVYAKYSVLLLSRLKRMVKMGEVVEELMQDIFVKVWTRRAEIDLDKSFEGWIFTVAQHTIFAYYRKLALDAKMRKHLIDTFAEFYDQTEDYILNKERLSLLNNAVEKLPQQRKEIFRLCKIEGKSYQETADLLSLSPSTVSNQLVSATKYIKKYVFFHSQEFILLCIAAYLRK